MEMEQGFPMSRTRTGDARAFTRKLIAMTIITAAAITFAIVRFGPSGAAEADGATTVRHETAADLLAAGDVGECGSTGPAATARLMSRLPGTIAVLGDEAYPNGSDHDFARCFDPTWGPLKVRLRPVPGNHEYRTENAAPYFRYFGAQAGEAGKGYYSYELGSWHVVALNSNVSASARSAQMEWLRADLDRARGRCILAYWHAPRFTVGPHGEARQMAPAWSALYEAGASVVLGGHDHLYQRFARLDGSGRRDPVNGVRQFVVGTGGAGLYRAMRRDDRVEVLNAATMGILHLRLLRDRYTWQFVPVAGGSFSDSGSAPCTRR
jgi:acid phosphatase type 7